MSEPAVHTMRDAGEKKRRARKPTAALDRISYRPAQAAEVLGVGRSTIFNMIAAGKIEARKIGGATVIRHEELVRVLEGSPLADATKAAQAFIR